MSNKAIRALALTIVGVGFVCSTPSLAGEIEMKAMIAKKSAILTRMHKKAKKALVNAVQDKAFLEYFTAPDPRRQRAAKRRIEYVSLNVQRKFHVEEMCLIAPTGSEITRIVGNSVAPDGELSQDEAEEIFFEPGFSLAPKRVYVSPPYISSDADKWVVAYATPVTQNGRTMALLHYEHDLDFYQRRLIKGFEGTDRFILLVTKDGYVIADSRGPVNMVKRDGKRTFGDYFVKLESIFEGRLKRFLSDAGDGKNGAATIAEYGDQYAVVFKRMYEGWTLMAVERQ